MSVPKLLGSKKVSISFSEILVSEKVSVSVLMKILVSSLSGAQADAFTKDCSVTRFDVLFAHAHASLIGAASGTVQQVWPINQGVL